jgi:hypothetical protein
MSLFPPSKLVWKLICDKYHVLSQKKEAGLGFELRTSCLQTLEQHLQFICCGYLWRWSLENYLPGLALNHDLPSAPPSQLPK